MPKVIDILFVTAELDTALAVVKVASQDNGNTLFRSPTTQKQLVQ